MKQTNEQMLTNTMHQLFPSMLPKHLKEFVVSAKFLGIQKIQAQADRLLERMKSGSEELVFGYCRKTKRHYE